MSGDLKNELAFTLPDGTQRRYPAGTTGLAIAQSIGPGLAKAAVGVRVGDELYDLARPLNAGGALKIVTAKDEDADALHLIRHSGAHVMAEAICALFPEAKLVYGPPVEAGFYYDIDCPQPIRAEDFAKIEKRMEEIIKENRPIVRVVVPREAGLAKVKAEGNPYKLDNAERAIGDLSFYVTGEPGKNWEDLCRGPHIPSTGRIGAFKVTSVAGAYYRGDATLQQLQRVYGKAYYKKATLDAEIKREEEAKKRDHRVIGKQLGLFTQSDLVGPGLILWMPKGATLRYELESWIRAELTKRGYQPVYTPHIGKLDLYKTSGHFPYFQDSQYPPIDMASKEKEETGYLLKPMNCPHHIQIYKAEPHSYRDLPVRLAEFGTVYRYEQSGELNGMTRVRGFTQDDAHTFCTQEQVEHEYASTVELVLLVLKTLGLNDYSVRVSLRDPAGTKYAGAPEVWDKAEATLRKIAREMKLPHVEAIGEAAFYGPKLDFLVKDCIGREWQLGTVQLDYNLPERFGLEYIGADNQAHRPVMIHRAPFGSMERFCGILIEHFAGLFPLWLAPVQAVILTVSQTFGPYAENVQKRLQAAGLRVELDNTPERIGAKIRTAQLAKVPVMVVVGEKEVADGTVAPRHNSLGQWPSCGLEEFATRLEKAYRERLDDARLGELFK